MDILDFRFSIGDFKSKIRNQNGLTSLWIYALISLLAYQPVSLLIGCGSDLEEERTSTPEEDVRSGWEEYRSGDYGAAILAFERALAGSADSQPAANGDSSIAADAYNGLGWVYWGFSKGVSVNQKNIATSLSKFQEAIARDSANADAWVGQAGLLLVRRSSQDDLRDAVKAIDNALQGDAKYLYRHDYNSEADLYTLKAQCYYYLGELDKAQDEVERALAIEKNNGVALITKGLL